MVWKHKIVSFSSVLWNARQMLRNWSLAQDRNAIPIAAHIEVWEGSEVWTKPRDGVVKINNDAALFAEHGSFGVASIARDHFGLPIEAFTCCNKVCATSDIAEAIGMKEVLS